VGDQREFGGVIGRTRAESEPWWPERPRPPAGAPNVLIVILDDVGYAQVGCYGSDVETPTLDRLAANGLQYTNFHTTALCSPTRGCVLTGRNHHSVGMGRVIDLATGFPGYDARIPPSCALLPEMLVPYGYAAYAVGKWHLTPEHEHHLGSPRGSWPLGRGFERYYGYFDGETSQFGPSLVHDNHYVPPPASWEDGYHLTEDLADHALSNLHDLRAAEPDKPFFLYFCPGACHSPHQAPQEWLDHYRGRFDQGWDRWRGQVFARQQAEGTVRPGAELSERPEWVPAWDDLSPDLQRLYARYMEAFAAYLSHADHHLGRILDDLEQSGELDNTLVMVISDNGASSEGGPDGSLNDARMWNLVERGKREAIARIDEIGGPTIHNNYPWGWTVAGNTPFRRWKRETHEGGVADPLIVSWPTGIEARGEKRHQYVHAIDLLPTVLEAIGVEAPDTVAGVAQRPVEGTSFVFTFADAAAPERHTTQYYEMLGCRAIYHDGWKAVTFHQIGMPDAEDAPWELYDVGADPSECHDLAAQEPERLQQMIDLWWSEAEKHQVLPLDANPFGVIFNEDRPYVPSRHRYEYRPGTGPVPEGAAVNVRNRSHLVTAEVDLSAPPTAEGVLIVQGSVLGGWVLFLADGHLHYAHNLSGREQHQVSSDRPVPPSAATVGMRFTKTGEHAGTATLLIDGEHAGSVEVSRFTPIRFAITGDGLQCGEHWGVPVVDAYRSPARFTGTLHRVVVEVDGEPFVDPDAEADHALREQ
jgi:arylsulfatase